MVHYGTYFNCLGALWWLFPIQ